MEAHSVTDDIVTRLREMATDRARYATHSYGCVERHLECAALRACDEIERLREQLQYRDDVIAMLRNEARHG